MNNFSFCYALLKTYNKDPFAFSDLWDTDSKTKGISAQILSFLSDTT